MVHKTVENSFWNDCC